MKYKFALSPTLVLFTPEVLPHRIAARSKVEEAIILAAMRFYMALPDLILL